MALVAKEIGEYKAHVVCLQEVEGKVFHERLYPALQRHGLKGWYSQKTEISTWGSAILWNGR